MLHVKLFCFQHVEQMIADVDKDGSGAIDFDEFVHMMTAKIGERDTKEDLAKAFNILDQDKNVSHYPHSFRKNVSPYNILS